MENFESSGEHGEQAEFSGSLNTIDRISRNIVAANEFERLAHAPKQNMFKINDCLYYGGLHNYNLFQDCHLQNYREVMVYFSKKELEEAKKWFPKVESLIVTGEGQTRRNLIENLINFREFVSWLMQKLKDHSLLMKATKDPNLAMLRNV